jgi:hypothetical protein
MTTAEGRAFCFACPHGLTAETTPEGFMPDETTPAPAPDSNAEPAATTPPVVAEVIAQLEPEKPADKPNPVNQLRTALDAEKAARKKVEDELKAIKLAQLSEIDRLKAENDELKPLRDEHGKFVSEYQAMFREVLDSLPEDDRQVAEDMFDSGSWADRLRKLRAYKTRIDATTVAAAGAAKPAPAGTVTNPATRKSGEPPLTQAMIAAMSVAEIRARKAEIDKFYEAQRGK